MSTTSVLCLSGVWPHATAATEAATTVAYAITKELARSGDFDVAYGVVNTHDVEWPAPATADRDELEALGVRFLPPVVIEPEAAMAPPLRRAAMVAAPHRAGLVPGEGATDALAPLIEAARPDVILTIWSEVATAAASGLALPKVAYYGNVAPHLTDAAFAIEHELGPRRSRATAIAARARRRAAVRAMARAHLDVMRRYDFVGDVAAHDAQWYVEHGVRAAYVRNMWPRPAAAGWEARRDAEEVESPLRIVGNVGNLSATGNTFGLHTLATEVVPALEERLGDAFEIHLYGARAPHPYVAPLLEHPRIRVRGFVDDLDLEMLRAPVFLVSNNHATFKVGHTRFLHAWSLGACVVAFEDSRAAMPEIRHGENALLGRGADEIAALVAEAAEDRELRRRIGTGGFDTLVTQFAPGIVVQGLAHRLRSVAVGG